MTQKKTQTDLSDVFKAYEKVFTNPFSEDNPFAKWMSDLGLGNLDPQRLIKENQDRLEALTRANQEAVAAFQAQVKRQAEIFDKIMTSARDAAGKIDVSGTSDAPQKNFAIYSEAMEAATKLMQKFAEESASASEEAYRKIMGEVETAAKSLKSK